MPFAFTLKSVIPASPKQIYDAWLDGKAHAAMTGAAATGSAKVGDKFTAWDGYIGGHNLKLSPGRKIVQAWRTSQFTGEHGDSQLELTLEKVATGTRLTLTHSNVPDGQTGYKTGWVDHYFEPMKRYFSALAKPVAKKTKAKTVKKATKSAKKKAPAKRRAKAKKARKK